MKINIENANNSIEISGENEIILNFSKEKNGLTVVGATQDKGNIKLKVCGLNIVCVKGGNLKEKLRLCWKIIRA